MYPPARGRSHLPVRSAQNALHRRAAPPCNPFTRRGSAPLAPPKGSLVLDLLQKGFPKNNTRLRLPLPARLCRATSPTGGGKSRLPLWGSCHGIAVTERGEPGTYSRPQPKIPAGEAQRNFPVPSGHRLKSRSAPQRRDVPCPHEPSLTAVRLARSKSPGGLSCARVILAPARLTRPSFALLNLLGRVSLTTVRLTRGHNLKFRRAEPRGIFPVLTSQVALRATYSRPQTFPSTRPWQRKSSWGRRGMGP